MRESCHRCGEELPAGSGESPFCPHCGSPQLTLSLDQQSVETGGEAATQPDGSPSTGTLPPPLPQQIDWRIAIRCALVVAAIGAVLKLLSLETDVLSPVSFVWMISGSLITVGLYHKQRPAASIDAGIGTRIGMLAGLCLALGAAISMAGWGVVERYALHGMGSFDAQMAAQMVQAQQQIQLRAAAQQTPIPPELMGLLKSPEFRAAAMLAGYAMLGAMLMLVSAIGGALAGMLRTRRRRMA